VRPQLGPDGRSITLEIVPRAAQGTLPVVLPRAPENARAVVAKFRFWRLATQLFLRPLAPPRTYTRPSPLLASVLPVALIGGLQQQFQSFARSAGIPVIGDLPLLGSLFRPRTRGENRPELLLFLTPRVLRGE
jgi:hypothetical protein